MISPMLLKSLKDKSNLKQYESDWIAQEKYDGTRIIVEKRNNNVSLYTRSGKNDLSAEYPLIVNELSRCSDTCFTLDAELVFFDKYDMPVFLTGLAKESRKDYTPYLIVFDILNINYRNCKNIEQKERTRIIPIFIKLRHFKYIKPIESFTSDFDALYNGIIARGGEGIVLKKNTAIYKEGTRSRDWLKVKRKETHDCFVIGLTNGTGKNVSTFGSLVIGQYDDSGNIMVCGNCGGFNDETRDYLYKKITTQEEFPSFYVTQRCLYKYVRRVKPELVIEVECMERYNTGVMRHPRFIQLRTDKLPIECVYNG